MKKLLQFFSAKIAPSIQPNQFNSRMYMDFVMHFRLKGVQS